MSFKFIFSISLLILIPKAFSLQELPFPKIWEMVLKNSPETKFIQLTKQASDKSGERLSRYRMPGFYASSQMISTNDPTLNFMNYLGEGQVRQDDFIISNLNSPSNHVFSSNQIGVDFRIFDGGEGISNLNSQKHLSISLNFEEKNIVLKEYVKTLKHYSKMILYKNYQIEIKPIESNLLNIIKNYHLGQKSNPLGYSGLLSLKSIKNKLDYINEENKNNIKNSLNSLNLLSGNIFDEWNSPSISIDKFVTIYFPFPKQEQNSYHYQAEIEKSNAIREKISYERSKYFPKVGAFSQANVYAGERGNNSAYIFGAYLKYNFRPSDYGSEEETEILSRAKMQEAETFKIAELVTKKNCEENINSIRNKLTLIENDENITDEQIKVLLKLFNNGNANISQIAELINKRIDLLANKYLLKDSLLNSDLELVSYTDKNVDPNSIWSLK